MWTNMIWSHLLKKSLMENFIFYCSVGISPTTCNLIQLLSSYKKFLEWTKMDPILVHTTSQFLKMLLKMLKCFLRHYKVADVPQSEFTCLKSTIATQEKVCEICSKLTLKALERHHWRRSGLFIVNHSSFIADIKQVNASCNKHCQKSLPNVFLRYVNCNQNELNFNGISYSIKSLVLLNLRANGLKLS